MKNENNKDWGLPEDLNTIRDKAFLEDVFEITEDAIIEKIKDFFSYFLKNHVKRIQTPSMKGIGYALHINKTVFLQEMINFFTKKEILFFAFHDVSNKFDNYADEYFNHFPKEMENLPAVTDEKTIQEADEKFRKIILEKKQGLPPELEELLEKMENKLKKNEELGENKKYPDVNEEDDRCDRH